MTDRGRHKEGQECWNRAQRNFILGSDIVALLLALVCIVVFGARVVWSQTESSILSPVGSLTVYSERR